MKRCQNCYNSFICKENTPLVYESHKLEEDVTCLSFEDDSEDYDDE